MAAGDWHIVMNYPAIDRFLNGQVFNEIAQEVGPRIRNSARILVPRRRGASLMRSLEWDRGADGVGPFVKIGGNIYDMDIEAPAEQFTRGHPKALKTSLIEVITRLEPIWGQR